MSPAGRPGAVLATASLPLERAPETQQADRLRLVPDARTIRRRRRWAVAITGGGLLLVFSVLLGLAVFQTFLAQGQARLDRLEQATRAAEVANEKLRLEVATLESPERVRSEALTRLGMAPAGTTTYVMPSAAAAAEMAKAADLGR